MQIYENKLKEILSDIASCETYFGEFSSISDIKIDPKKMPIIYVDFLGETPVDNFEVSLEFALYIAHASFSKNENTRDLKRYEIYDMLNDINKTLQTKNILNSLFVKVKASSKILDAKSSTAYMTIFKKNIEFSINKNQIEGSLIE